MLLVASGAFSAASQHHLRMYCGHEIPPESVPVPSTSSLVVVCLHNVK